jgi:acyl-CoA synthetase (AMP-forming)/AMP-acid ligase II
MTLDDLTSLAVEALCDGPEGATIGDVLRAHAMEAPAICAPDRAPATFGVLAEQCASVMRALNGWGIGRGDRVAVALSNRADMAVAMLAITDCAACAPLNPHFPADEFRTQLTDLGADLLILAAGSDSPGRGVAVELGIPVVDFVPAEGNRIGCFALAAATPLTGGCAEGGPARPDDTAFLLRTSGTTGTPDTIPWSHRKFVRQAGVQAAWLRLTASDCGMSMMPMHHGAAINSALLMPLVPGGRVVCLEQFSADGFYRAIADFQPSWYTAGVAYQQEILARAGRHVPIIRNSRIRFIRSGSGALPEKVQIGLEEKFDAPVVQRYGLTETIGTVTCNPLPPGRRKAGTAGLPVGCEVAIMDQDGTHLADGTRGEIVVRGPSVVTAPGCGISIRADGWLRTGDMGFLDDDGYLCITGRLKEMINRGGEKISPAEIDAALMRHPHVADAAAFAIPHRSLGEIVGAAIVLAAGAGTGKEDMDRFLKGLLSPIKRPKAFLFLDEIPRTPLRKVKRAELTALYERTR